MDLVSTKSGQSNDWQVSSTRLLEMGHLGSYFWDGAPRIYKHWESSIFMIKVRSLLKGDTCSVVLKLFSDELGKL